MLVIAERQRNDGIVADVGSLEVAGPGKLPGGDGKPAGGEDQ